MPTLFKNRKKRESHHKSDEGSSLGAHSMNQRSPSTASTKSSDSPVRAGAQGSMPRSTKGAVLGSNGPASSGPVGPHHLADQGGKHNTLNSPFLGRPEDVAHHGGPEMGNSGGNQTPGGVNSGTSTGVAGSPSTGGPGAPAGSPYGPQAHASDTPWAEYAVQRAVPSPRFGHSANYISARDGELFIMGGIRDMDILNDLWVIDTKTLTGYQLIPEGAKVGPRVGHASLVLGNAHVVFGGDTKIEESDPLDDNLYLLNTSSLKWTVAQPQGPRPSGRYGHSLSNVGARVYVFGGQVDEEFYDDMWSFDLTTWRSPTAKWDRIEPATPPPPPRTNHTVVTYEDKLYLFGGANGDLWYSDTWRFDPTTRVWEQLECTGYVPAPCQGHASTIIGDVMYVFGGMSSQGQLIDQLFALKLTTLKWYTFQNLGPGPSPRSGHSLTAFGLDKILVWGGTDQGNSAYVLDVSRINYPDESAQGQTPVLGSNAKDSLSATSPSRGQPGGISPGRQNDEPHGHGHPSSDEAVAAAAAAAAGADGAAAFGTAAGVGTPGRDAPLPPTPEARPPVTTTKEVRELQPHVYAPHSSEVPGPTQAKSNSAARNSMLFSKRRSVLLPSSPTKTDFGNAFGSDSNGVQNYDGGARKHGSEGPTTIPGIGGPAPLGSFNEEATRSPNRANAQVKSYVTEPDGDSPDERFVSAVDLNEQDNNGEAPKITTRARGHSRGLSFGVNPSVTEERKGDHSEHNLKKLEGELNGMPGSLPMSDNTADFANGVSSNGPSLPNVNGVSTNGTGGLSDPTGANEKITTSNGSSYIPSDVSISDPNSPPTKLAGLRRSQPQANLSLNQGDKTEPDLSRDISHGSISGSPSSHSGMGIIGLSDEMSVPSSSVHAQLYDKSSSTQEPLPKQSSPKQGSMDERLGPLGSSPAKMVSKKSPVIPQDIFVPPSNLASRDTLGEKEQTASHMSEAISGPGSSDSRSATSEGGSVGSSMQKSVSGADKLTTMNSSTKPGDNYLNGTPNGPHTTTGHSDVSFSGSSGSAGFSGSEDKAIPSANGSNLPSTGSQASYDMATFGAAGAVGAAAEIAALRKQLDAYRQRDFNDEHHQLKQAHAQQQRDLTNLRDANAQLTRKHAATSSQNSDLKQRYDHMEGILDGHVATLKSQQAALDEANFKLAEQQQQLTQFSVMQSENADLKLRLKTAEANERHAKEQLDALNNSYSALKSAHSDLSARHLATGGSQQSKDVQDSGDMQQQVHNNVNHLVTVWGNFKQRGNSDATARDLTGSGQDYRQLYETQKEATETAQRELQSAYASQTDLKSQLRELSSLYASSHSEADMAAMKEKHSSELGSLDKQHKSTVRELNTHASELADLRARLRRLESSYSELQGEYTKAVDLSRNQQAALTRTREELNMSRAHVQRLEEQLEDANLQNSTHTDHVGGNEDLSHASVGSNRNDQAGLVIRDLRAQIVILEEEVEQRRQQNMSLKKQLLTKS